MPPIPYGYSMQIIQNTRKPLNATDLYICAIEAAFHWAAEEYNQEIPDHSGHSKIVHGLQFSFHDVPDRPINMYWKHVILAILISMNTMDERQTFAETIIVMKQDRKTFGVVEVAKRSDSDSTPITRTVNDSTSKTISEYVPEWGNMTITYQRFNAGLDCNLLFSTALDGITYLASDDWGDTWSFSTCYNWSKKMMYQTVEVKINDGGSAWTPDVIKRVARLLPLRLLSDNDCGEVRFRVEMEGIGRVGTGSFQELYFAHQESRGID
ncbi:MAG: hypothetical protein Q9220_002182 [cf. Caloplaca sp. 1 TL-2023]